MTRPHFLRYMNLLDLLRGAVIVLLAIGCGVLAAWIGWVL